MATAGRSSSVPGHPGLDEAAPIQAGPALHTCVSPLLPEGVFNPIVRGGPFGRAGQVDLARMEPRHPAFTAFCHRRAAQSAHSAVA
jgi:hypothetical protein